jgi:hypothetical protein
MRIAFALLVAAFVLNVAVLVGGGRDPGLPLVTAILLGAAGLSLLTQRRPWT